jgi:beta-glucanase (GH16 family)
LVWSDEFSKNGGPDPSKWNTNTDCTLPGMPGPGCGNNEQQYYKPSGNAVCSGGYLTITAKNENFGGRQFTSAKLISQQVWTYGVFEARMKMK